MTAREVATFYCNS